MSKGRLFLFSLVTILVLSMSIVSADLLVREEFDKSYIRDYDIWIYKEDLYGKNRGFTLKHYSSSPKYRYEYEDEYPYITWGYTRTRNRYYRPYYYGKYDGYYNIEPVFRMYRAGRDSYYYRYPSRSYGYRIFYRPYRYGRYLRYYY
jgi:hypothetical protein